MRATVTVFISVLAGFFGGQHIDLKSVMTPQNPSVLVDQAFDKFQSSQDNPYGTMVDKAINYCETALTLTNQFYKAHQLLATIHMDRGNYATAMVHWQKVLEQQPEQDDLNITVEKKIKSCVEGLVKEYLPPTEVNGILAMTINDLEARLQNRKEQISRMQDEHKVQMSSLSARFETEITTLQNQIAALEQEKVRTQKVIIDIQKQLAEVPDARKKSDLKMALSTITDDELVEYTVRRGDTFSSIAKQNGIEVKKLAYINEVTDPNRLNIGDILLIPVPRG